MIDNGYMGEDDMVLAPLLTVRDEVPTGGLSLDHSMTLGSLSRAASDLDTETHTIDMIGYSIIDIFLSDKIGLDYEEPEITTNIVNYVGKSLVARKSTVDAIGKAHLKENTGKFHQAKFHV